MVGYFVVAAIAMPLRGAIWLGELPVLAIVQLPKLWLADALRAGVAVPLIRTLGLSRGSFSPDFVLARPYALVTTYAILVVPMILALRVGRVTERRHTISLLLLGAAVTDFAVTLWLADGSNLSMY